jgi:hypothetical protein
MKKILLIVLGVILMAAGLTWLVGCDENTWVTASNKTETREYALAGFTDVVVSGGIEVNITRADTYRVAITTSDNLFDYIEVTVTNNTLRIRPKTFFTFDNADFHAEITLPELYDLTLAGATNGVLDGFTGGGSVDIEVSGASKLELVNMKTEEVNIEVSGASRLTGALETGGGYFEVSGASQLTLTGTADTATFEVSGASSARLADFPIGDTDVTLSGASNASVTVNGRINVEVSGASRLTYAGDPILGRIDVSGASSISRR